MTTHFQRTCRGRTAWRRRSRAWRRTETARGRRTASSAGQTHDKTCQRFCVCFILKFALPPSFPSGVQISRQNTHGTFDPINNLSPVYFNVQASLFEHLRAPCSVLDKVHREDRVHIKSKTVNFSWQRGNKIGQVRKLYI